MNKIVFSGHQPNFLPYMGFFYKIFKSDVFVLDDDVKYSRTELHNANFIKVNGKKFKLTVPVSYEYGDLINEVRICRTNDWETKALKTIRMNYGKAPYFDEGYEFIEKHFGRKYEYLADMNISMIKEIAEKFHIDCDILVASSDVPTDLKKNERNIYQCNKLGGKIYYSGIGGKDYNDEEEYRKNEIQIVYSDYQPVFYNQTQGEFIENLSVIDYIFNNGYKLPERWVK